SPAPRPPPDRTAAGRRSSGRRAGPTTARGAAGGEAAGRRAGRTPGPAPRRQPWIRAYDSRGRLPAAPVRPAPPARHATIRSPQVASDLEQLSQRRDVALER